MANREHVARLKKGVAIWNAWRKKTPAIRPMLQRGDLDGTNLSGGYFKQHQHLKEYNADSRQAI